MHICQLAYYVESAQAAALEWVNNHGAGPFYLSRNIPLVGVFHDGQPSSLDHTSAYGWLGDQMVELVQQNCTTPSVFSNRQFGLHHCAYFTPELDAELARLERLGYQTRFRAGTSGGVQFAFSEPGTESAQLGHFLEIYQDHPSLRQFYALIESAAENWDGSEPLREMQALARS